MALGTDMLLDSLLRLAGVDVEKSKEMMKGFAQKFIEQDTLLRENNAMMKAIIKHFNIELEAKSNGEIPHEQSGGSDGGRRAAG